MSSPLTSAQRIVHSAKQAAYRAGFEVRRETFKRHFVHSLHQHGIDTVLDVGANRGQFATALRRAGFAGRILSVEPLADAFASLERASSSDGRWVVRQAAVGDRPGTLTVHVAANSVSSSVLPMLERHAQAAPQSRYVDVQEVAATTVDDLVEEHRLVLPRTLLKIDVQGYEGAVLDGAERTLGAVAGVRTEMSLVALYDGQALLGDVLARLEGRGFELWSLDPGFVEPGTGRLLQTDGVFFRATDASDTPGADRGQ